MNIAEFIPVVVGVTGHRDLIENEIPLLREQVRRELRGIKDLCPSSPLVVMTSLAEGADQLCAEAALEEGCELVVPLPMEPEEYQNDFDGESRQKLDRLMDQAAHVFVVPETESYPVTDRRYYYRQAGIYVASHCHVLLALWDGNEAVPDGCGTAEAVDFMRHNSYREPAFAGLHPGGGRVIWIKTNRRGGRAQNAAGAVPEVTRFGEADCEAILRETDLYNRECARRSGPADRPAERVGAVYNAADGLSIENAGRYRRTIASLSLGATLITMAFLLYDEATQYWMIILVGLLLGGLFVINAAEKRLLSHKKYIEYRILAEGARVQGYLNRAGIAAEGTDLLPWSWQMDAPWVASALAVLTIGGKPDEKKPIRDVWICDQMAYHKSAIKKTALKAERNERIMKVSLTLSILSYIGALVFEIYWGGLFTGNVRLDFQVIEQVRTILKIVLGSLSAMTLFAGNYYGKLSLDEVMEDHRHMIGLYEMADLRIRREGETEDFLIKLAREELGENSRWYSYQSMNKPDIGL